MTCALALACACGDNRSGGDAGLQADVAADTPAGDLFGEPCEQPAFPEVGICHDGDGACHDEAGGPVCRPFCHVDGVAQCAARNGTELLTDRGACVCIPAP